MAEGAGSDEAKSAAPEGSASARPTAGAPGVFLSYATPDIAVAEAACKALERNGITCWIAPRDVAAGEFLNTSQWLDANDGVPGRAFPQLVEAVRRVLGAEPAGSTQNPITPLPVPVMRNRSISRTVSAKNSSIRSRD